MKLRFTLGRVLAAVGFSLLLILAGLAPDQNGRLSPLRIGLTLLMSAYWSWACLSASRSLKPSWRWGLGGLIFLLIANLLVHWHSPK
jgi:hypothetical protein